PLSVMERLVNQALIPHDEAMNELVSQGYSTDRATQILALFGDDKAKADLAAKAKADAATAAEQRRKDAEARRQAAEQARLHPTLTESQIIATLKAGNYTVDEAMTALSNRGYSVADAMLLVENVVGPIMQEGGSWVAIPAANNP